MLFCIGVACLHVGVAAIAPVDWRGRPAFDACWLLSIAMDVLLRWAGPLDIILVVPTVVVS